MAEEANPCDNCETPSEKKPDGEENVQVQKEEPQAQRQPKPVTISDVELEQLKKEVGEYKDKYLRILAESENARKRLYKERQEVTQFAIQNVIVDFLNPIDHMENALRFTEQMSEEVKHWALGFQMILGQFKEALNSNGVQAFASVAKPFDPHLHEAIEMVETEDFPPGSVVEESVRGYKMGDRVIRPALVKVAKAISEETSDDENNSAHSEKNKHKI